MRTVAVSSPLVERWELTSVAARPVVGSNNTVMDFGMAERRNLGRDKQANNLDSEHTPGVPGIQDTQGTSDIADSPDCSQGMTELVDTAAADNQVEHSFVGVLDFVRDHSQADRSVPADVVVLPADAVAVPAGAVVSPRVAVHRRCQRNHLRIIPAVFFVAQFFYHWLQELLPAVGF